MAEQPQHSAENPTPAEKQVEGLMAALFAAVEAAKAERAKRGPLSPVSEEACDNFIPHPDDRHCVTCGWSELVHLEKQAASHIGGDAS